MAGEPSPFSQSPQPRVPAAALQPWGSAGTGGARPYGGPHHCTTTAGFLGAGSPRAGGKDVGADASICAKPAGSRAASAHGTTSRAQGRTRSSALPSSHAPSSAGTPGTTSSPSTGGPARPGDAQGLSNALSKASIHGAGGESGCEEGDEGSGPRGRKGGKRARWWGCLRPQLLLLILCPVLKTALSAASPRKVTGFHFLFFPWKPSNRSWPHYCNFSGLFFSRANNEPFPPVALRGTLRSAPVCPRHRGGKSYPARSGAAAGDFQPLPHAGPGARGGDGHVPTPLAPTGDPAAPCLGAARGPGPTLRLGREHGAGQHPGCSGGSWKQKNRGRCAGEAPAPAPRASC